MMVLEYVNDGNLREYLEIFKNNNWSKKLYDLMDLSKKLNDIIN